MSHCQSDQRERVRVAVEQLTADPGVAGPTYAVFVVVVWLALPEAIALDSREFVDTP